MSNMSASLDVSSLLVCKTRTLVRLSGSEAESLLQRLITTNLDQIGEGEAGYGALLSPQGKVLFDFLVVREKKGEGAGFLFDLEADMAADFIKKMTLYRLRSDVVIEELDWDIALSFDEGEGGIADPRSPLLGWRHYGPNLAKHAQYSGESSDKLFAAHWQACVPHGSREEGSGDFLFGDVFPHDINMDHLGGIDYHKGCYVGQEVVSRMHHRGTARRRLVKIASEKPLESHAPLMAGGKTIGNLGRAQGGKALALVRLDRLAASRKDGVPVSLEEGGEVSIELPAYADFSEQFEL